MEEHVLQTLGLIIDVTEGEKLAGLRREVILWQVGALLGPGPCGDRALADVQRRVRDHELCADVALLLAQSLAARTGAGRGVRGGRLRREPALC